MNTAEKVADIMSTATGEARSKYVIMRIACNSNSAFLTLLTRAGAHPEIAGAARRRAIAQKMMGRARSALITISAVLAAVKTVAQKIAIAITKGEAGDTNLMGIQWVKSRVQEFLRGSQMPLPLTGGA